MKTNDLLVLSPEEILLIHKNSLKILEEVGILVESKKILDILKENGCDVDYDKQMVKIPADIVEKCIKTAPSEIKMFDRDGKYVLTVGDGNRYCVSGHNAVFVIEDEDGTRRNSTVGDVKDFAIISDYLSDVDIIGVPVMPQDVTPKMTLAYAVKAIIENSKKPVFFSSESEIVNKAIVEMDKLVMGKSDLSGGCNLISQLSTTSPLYWERGAAEALYFIAKEGIPVDFLPQPITGVTAPYTLAGILTVHNTEVLSGVVIAQLINPGTPVIYGAGWTTYEMKLMNVLIGRPEASILRVAGAQMSHFYNIPCHAIGPDTDSNLHDEQNAWEKMLSTIAGLVGANDLLVNLGMFGTGMCISLEQLVMDNEICRIVKRFITGIEVTEETIAFDTIKNVGPRGIYMMEDHTFDYLRSDEHVELSVSNSANFEMWRQKGANSIVANAKRKAAEILGMGNKCPLDEEVISGLNAIIKRYESEL